MSIGEATVQAAHSSAPTRNLAIRGTEYPVLLPSRHDTRLHLAAVVISIQVLGQVSLEFPVSIAQILVSLLTCAVIEFSFTFVNNRVIAWPASALLTGNGVAIIFRVEGTQHGDWWSLEGWYLFVGTAALAMLTKYLITTRGSHIFNPANVALVTAFLVLGSELVEPQDLWWGPLDTGLYITLGVIAAGSLLISYRIGMASMSVGFWLTFGFGVWLQTIVGHYMVARWHLGPISGAEYWRTLVLSPEVLVFQFFMITDPKTSPLTERSRALFGIAIGATASILVSFQSTEYATKVAILGSLTLICLVRGAAMAFGNLKPLRSPVLVGGLAAIAIGASPLISLATDSELPESFEGGSRVVDIEDLPKVSISDDLSRINSPVDSTLANQIVSEVIADLELESDAIANGNADELSGALVGKRLEETSEAIAEGSAEPIRYQFDSAEIVLMERTSPQAPPVIGVELTGKTQSSDGQDGSLDATYAVSYRNGAWLIADMVVGE